MWDVVFTWGVFAGVASTAFVTSEMISRKHANMVSASLVVASQPTTAANVRAYLVVLTIYALVMFYLITILACGVIFACGWMIHTCVEAVLRTEDHEHWMIHSWARKTLNAVDHLTDPALMFHFMSSRLWGIHSGVMITTLAIVGIQVLLFTTTYRLRRLGIIDGDGGKPSDGALETLFSEMINTAATTLVALYSLVFVREAALLMKLTRLPHSTRR